MITASYNADKRNMITLQDIYEMLPEIELVNDEIRQMVNCDRVPTAKIGGYLLDNGGKRIRPLLTLACGRCFSVINKDIIRTAAAAELIHMASLVHDDIIDNSFSRRGKPTVNAIYSNKIAVLEGDNLFAKAFHLLVHNKLYCQLEQLVEVISVMCNGEINQLNNGYNYLLSEQQYYKIIYQKTAKLIAFCCSAGAKTAGADEEKIKMLERYGRNVGYVFQITDDILDLRGDSKKTGKPTGLDITQGTLTLPVILLLKKPGYVDWLAQLLNECDQDDVNDRQNIVGEINSAVKKTGAMDEAYEQAVRFCSEAKGNLICLEDSIYKEALIKIADIALMREK